MYGNWYSNVHFHCLFTLSSTNTFIHLSHCITDKLKQNPSRPVCNATSQYSSFHPFQDLPWQLLQCPDCKYMEGLQQFPLFVQHSDLFIKKIKSDTMQLFTQLTYKNVVFSAFYYISTPQHLQVYFVWKNVYFMIDF